MDRPPNNTNNSSTSHSYSRTTGPVREYVTEYRTTLPAPRPPVSTNITTYTYGNPNGTEFQSTVTTKDFAPVIRSATYGRPPPPEFGMNSDLEFQKLSNFPNHRPVVGNTSSSSSHFSSNASANGNVAIVEVSAEGKFIAVENTHGTKDENLAGWKIKRCVDGRAPLVFHFPGGVSVRPLGKVKIWAGKGEGGRHKSAGELMFDGVDSWGVGSEMKTVLVDKEGVASSLTFGGSSIFCGTVALFLATWLAMGCKKKGKGDKTAPPGAPVSAPVSAAGSTPAAGAIPAVSATPAVPAAPANPVVGGAAPVVPAPAPAIASPAVPAPSPVPAAVPAAPPVAVPTPEAPKPAAAVDDEQQYEDVEIGAQAPPPPPK